MIVELLFECCDDGQSILSMQDKVVLLEFVKSSSRTILLILIVLLLDC